MTRHHDNEIRRRSRPPSRALVYVILVAILAIVVYAFTRTGHRLDEGMTLTPREYIELVERKKAERLGQPDAPASQTAPPSAPPARPEPVTAEDTAGQ